MAFKPNRELLNVNFEGYKLSEALLSHVSKELPEAVQVAKLKDEDYSYEHMRAYSLHNHLAVDPNEDSSVYWYTSDGKIQRGSYTGDEISVQTCYSLPPPVGTVANPSFSFINGTHCLFSNGGPRLFVFATDSAPPSTDSASSNEWQLELTVPANSGKDGTTCNNEGTGTSPIMILAATVSKSKLYVDVLLAELCDPSSVQHVKSSTSTDSSVATFKWLRFTLPGRQQDADSANTAGISFEDAEVSVVALFESRAFPHYTAIIEKNVLLVSEARPALPEDSDSMEVGRAAEGGEEAEKKKEGEEHHGLGYDNLGYQWSQTDTDVTVTLTLPEGVSKADIECEIETSEVVLGLTDGTTYLRGKLHASIDPEASAWTLEKNILEVTLEKKEHGQEWPYLHGDAAPNKHIFLSEREDGLTREELERAESLLKEMKNKSAASSDVNKSPSETPPPSKRPRPMVQMPQEDCDASSEDMSLFVVSERSTVAGKYGLGGRQIVFTSPGAKDFPPYIAIRHDVDAVVWQPINGATAWDHVTTFNALGYIQASKEDRKFTVAPPSLKFVAVSDCKRHVFVYLQPPQGVEGNSSVEGVHTMADRNDILGLRASDKGLVFVLTPKNLTVLKLSL